MYYITLIQNPLCCSKFRHIQAYSRPMQTYSVILWHSQCNSCVFKILPYSESWHIQNPRYIQNMAYPEYGSYIQSSCIFRTIRILIIFIFQEYSGIFNNDSYSNINFIFFTLILHTFQRNLKRHVFLMTIITLIFVGKQVLLQRRRLSDQILLDKK